MARLRLFFMVLLAVCLLLPFVSAADNGTCSIGENVCAVGESVEQSLSPSIAPENLSNVTCVAFFYGIGCSKCAEVEPFIDELALKYCDRVKIHYLEVYHNASNYDLYKNYADMKGIPEDKRGIPLVAIGDKYFMGTSQIRDNLEAEILRENPLESVCPLTGEPGCSLEYDPTKVSPPVVRPVSLWLIVIAGLVDSINPCAFAVMIFLLTFLIQVSSSKGRVLKAGVAYIASVYVTYFLSGLGLLSFVQLLGVSSIMVKAAAVVSIFAGLINIKDYFWYGKGFTLKIPDSKKGIIERWVHHANVPGAIVLGFLVSMFELPCTGGVYLAILALLADSMTHGVAMAYLLIYNVMFVAPLAVILLFVMRGMKAERLESWRESGKSLMKLSLGLLLVFLGVAMLLGWSL
ncbi:MAG: cytochrome c biogenesis CcdA family protein [Candidatus Altiarchaeota archaeon]|nr:cytochrome c biogenesis CcdA family protein [Candidatus Altiarchaeota archaeon]